MKVRELEDWLRGLRGGLNAEEGLLTGDADAPVRGVLVCWMATVEAIRKAIEIGADCIITHEALFYPYPGIRGLPPPLDHMSWPPNRRRMELLARGNIAVFRVHSTLDRLCIFQAFVDALGLPPPVVSEDPYVTIHVIEPTPIGAVIRRVKDKLRLDAVRVTPCDLDRRVRRIALPHGGAALFVNVSHQARLLRHNPELFIAGESDAYGMIFAIDSGVPMIETGHETSENMGLRAFADRMKSSLPDVPVHFYKNPRPWITC